jgi:regulator of protease activity HflC (stomatin/prohibitin superfamily)
MAKMASKERPVPRAPGVPSLVVLVALVIAAVLIVNLGIAGVVVGSVIGLVALVGFSGLTAVPPNQSRVVTFFGRYVGTVRRAGLSLVVPLTNRQHISLRVRYFETDVLKVNDARGNPVEISAVINWQVVDTAMAAFDVDDYEDFVHVQAETAIRHVASVYPYDAYEGDVHSLRGNADEVEATLRADLQRRLDVAGVEVLLVGLRRLAYAPEIAADMLRRQQAEAVVAARRRIVEGAVGMVDQALVSLNERGIVELDEERKAVMVSNLMVVLVSDRGAQPVVNSGSLY